MEIEKGEPEGSPFWGISSVVSNKRGNTAATEAEHRKHTEGRATQHEGSYMEMGSLAWRETYQQGFSLE